MGFLIACWLVAASIPAHLPTWAYDEYHGQGTHATSAQVQRYVTYAEGGLENDKALRDCDATQACAGVFYFDPGLIYASADCPILAYREFLARASEDWFVHERGYADAAHRVRGTYEQRCHGTREAIPVYAANQTNPAVDAFFAQYLRRVADRWPFYLADDTSDTVITQFYGPGGGFCSGLLGRAWCTTTQELPDDAAVATAHLALANALVHADGSPMALFYNGVSFARGAPEIPPLLAAQRFTGVVCENCAIVDGTLRPTMYARVLDAMARVAAVPNASFVLLSSGSQETGSDAQIAARIATTAIVWLGFTGAHTIVWPNLEDRTDRLAVWPEDEVYPARPLQTMRGSNAALLVAPGVWRREFTTCYRASVPIGACAAVVNGSRGDVTIDRSWFHALYAYALVPAGGDLLGGGTLRDVPLDAEIARLAPGEAALLVSK